MALNIVKAVAAFTFQGRRPVQEDFVVVNKDKGVFAIADGFGGQSGAEAAKTACESVRSFLDHEAGDLEATLPFVIRNYFSLAGNVLFNSFVHANRKVLALNKDRNVHEKGGASVIAGFLDGDLLALANVGACSAWLIREGRQMELVMPRTYGKLLNPYASDNPSRMAVPLMALGMQDDLEPEIFEYRVKPGDWLLLHSDGLSASARAKLCGLQGVIHGDVAVIDGVSRLVSSVDFDDNAAISLVIF
jgi:protein phosphatase